MSKVINNELLSAILGKELEVRGFRDKFIPENFEYIEDMINVKTINIHELSNKCKIWAYENGYFVKTGVMASVLLRMPDLKEVNKCYNCNFDNLTKFDPLNDILVSEWILDNKS